MVRKKVAPSYEEQKIFINNEKKLQRTGIDTKSEGLQKYIVRSDSSDQTTSFLKFKSKTKIEKQKKNNLIFKQY
jgi:hypothetical protein